MPELSTKRLSKLLQDLQCQHPDDWYANSMAAALLLIPEVKAQVGIYDRALQLIDVASWEQLQSKAIRAFKQESPGRGKSAFFNQLNEAFAYRHLVQRGNTSVRLLPESKRAKSPDISFQHEGIECYCEVKTIGISQDAIQRYENMTAYSTCIHQSLSEEFLAKLRSTVQSAFGQVHSRGPRGLVYVIAHFDDFTLSHYATYRAQIADLLRSQFPDEEVYVKVGIQGRKHIHHRPPSGTKSG